jgi:membrane protease YdiL (CAAX protease family)
VGGVELAPYQIALLSLELLLLLVGGWVLARLLGTDERRVSTLSTNRLTYWSVNGAEFALAILLVFLLGAVGQSAFAKLTAGVIKGSPDKAGLEVVVNGLGFHGCALLGWPIFHLLRRQLYRNYQTEAPSAVRPPHVPAGKSFTLGFGTLLIALPIVTLVSLGWTAVLRAGGMSDEPQDLIAIFGGARSPLVVTAMLAVACIVAPINEELLFRGGIYRFCRQKLGRFGALVISAGLFGASHINLAGFLPLAVLGAVFALAYEATGDIRVPIIAHGLFNLNTIVVVLSGLSNST